MFDFMDEIVEIVEKLPEAAGKVAEYLAVLLIKAALVITAPAWVLPYKAWRSWQQAGQISHLEEPQKIPHCENPDCENCPFPPCEKRGGREMTNILLFIIMLLLADINGQLKKLNERQGRKDAQGNGN